MVGPRKPTIKLILEIKPLVDNLIRVVTIDSNLHLQSFFTATIKLLRFFQQSKSIRV